MDRSFTKAISGIVLVTLLILAEIILSYITQIPPAIITEIIPQKDRVTFLAFGDINLGRRIGQRILNGETHYPFQKIDLRSDSADIVFANLESQISNQNGETVSPRSNIVFVGPPEGAQTLRIAGINIVSTANNHAFDYGMRGLRETIDFLNAETILHAGTSKFPKKQFNPLIIEKNNIKFAIFAVTSFVNFNPKRWKEYIAWDDTVRLASEIRKIRDSSDVIIMSYHGGVEYTARPVDHVKQFAEWCIRNDVDIFLGHHPHVTFGVEKKSRKVIIHSLGNFVFYQPQTYWTQRSYGVKFWIEKTDSSVQFDIERFIPLKVGFQTERLIDSAEVKKLKDRTQKLSNFDLTTYWD